MQDRILLTTAKSFLLSCVNYHQHNKHQIIYQCDKIMSVKGLGSNWEDVVTVPCAYAILIIQIKKEQKVRGNAFMKIPGE